MNNKYALSIFLFLAFPAGTLWSQAGRAVPFTLKTTAFSEGGAIPRKHTCDGADLSPALAWSGIPAGTQSLVLIVDDPDAPAGTWTHWIAWNIPPTAALSEGVPKVERLGDGTLQGQNDFRRIGYGGPCPPPGKAHRYFFKLYALNAKLDLTPGSTREELERALKGHVLGEAKMMGKCGR